MISKIKYEYILFFIALIWVFIFSFALQLAPHFNFLGDDITYLEASKMLYHHGQLSPTRPLLIAAIFGFPYLCDGSTEMVLQWSFLINFCIWFFSIILFFRIVEVILNRKNAFFWSLLFVFCIGNLAYAFQFLPEALFSFLLLLAVFFITKYSKTQKKDYIVLALIVLFLCALIKPVALGFAIVLLIFYVKKVKYILFSKFSVVLVLSWILIFFQVLSIKKSFGDYTISYIGAVTYYNYVGAKADCYRKNIEFIPGENQRAKTLEGLSSHQIKILANEDFKEQFKNNKLNLVKAYIFCLYSNSSKGNYIVSECKNESNTSYFDSFQFLFKGISKIQNNVFTLVGLLLSFLTLIQYKTSNSIQFFCSFGILFIVFISGISCFQCDRFHIVIYSMVLVLLLQKMNSSKHFSEPLQK
ncbi:hypothetical protein [Flavobacterium sp.]|jgi:hypothetical protein|uniref:hypothetical protein n=1 Tax=Flavobacterium sp. TaxID=239 RepID=UPI0037BEE167